MNKIKLSILTVALGGVVMSCSQGEQEAVTDEVSQNVEMVKEEVSAIPTISKDVNADEFKSLFESGEGTLVDVRTPGEVAEGAIEGAVNIDFNSGNFEEEIAKLDKEAPVYVYCKSGGRSGKAKNMMKDMGFSEVYNLVGGYGNWPYKE